MTLLFNAGTGQVKPLRSKEESHDYRYFPDPDLPPLVLDDAWIAERRDGAARAARGAAQPPRDGARHPGRTTRGSSPARSPLADYFESVVAAGVEPKTAANWVMGDVMPRSTRPARFRSPPGAWRASSAWCARGTLSHQAAKRVYAEMAQSPDGEPAAVAERLGLVQVSDQGALGDLGGRGARRASRPRSRATRRARRSSWRSSSGR